MANKPSINVAALKKPLLTILAAAVVAALAAYFLAGPRGQYVAFNEFEQLVESGSVESVVISDDSVSFAQVGDESSYYTDNPSYDSFQYELLMNGVSVEVNSAYDSVTLAMDVLFYVFFFGVLVWAIFQVINFQRTTFKVVRKTGVSFDDIAGMEAQKKELSMVVDMLKHPEEYERKGIRPPRGVVLEGPPGNGKTLFAKALATEADVRFIATRGADFQGAFMSMGASKIKSMFKVAKRKRPCIVFIDEFDSIGERRNYAGTGVDKENNRIITTMLNEMDGFNTSDGVLIIAATNSYASLDAALIRPGRFDLKYTIGLPDAATRKELVDIYMKNRTLAEDVNKDDLVSWTDGLSCADVEALINEAQTLVELRKGKAIRGNDFVQAAAKVHVRLKR